jgi:RNA polymerase sigma-70 factor (ECF subfamily)
MERYQRADPGAPATLIAALSPVLLRFFQSQIGNREQAEDLLQDTWLRIHRVRHTYRPGEPLLPWVYAIARRAGVDGYRKRRRIAKHEITMDQLPENPVHSEPDSKLAGFEAVMALLPPAERETIAMLKLGGLSLEEVACATSSTVGAVKQRAHRAYERLRKVLIAGREDGVLGETR